MPRLAKPKTEGTVKANDLKKQLGVQAAMIEQDEPVTTSRRGRKPKAEVPPLREETQGKKTSKVTPLKARQSAKAEQTAPAKAAEATAPVPPKTRGKAGKVAPSVPADEDLGESEALSWDKLFPPVFDSTKFRYVRQNSDKLTLADLQKHLPKFDTYVLMAEQRKEDNQFTKLVMCFVSKETVTLIDQTGGEDFDSIVQVKHEELLGQKEFHVRKATFPFAIYFKEAKK